MSEEKDDGAQSPPPLRRFTIIWIGQIVSLLGSGLTSFALGIWVLQKTGSVTQFTLLAVIAGLPGLLMSPLAGAIVDRFNRKMILIVTDVIVGIFTLVIAALLYYDALEVWHIYVSVVLSAIFASFQWPAFVASLSLIVQPKDYVKVNGMLQFGRAGTTIAAPGIAGFLMFTFDIWVVLAIDVASFLFAAGALLVVKIPQPKTSAVGRKAKGSIWQEALFGWKFIRERPGLLGLLLFFAGVNFVHSMCGIAVIPMVLKMTDSTAVVGAVAAFVGVGALIGSMYMTSTGGPKKRVHGVFGLGLASGVLILICGATPYILVITAAVMLWNAAVPIANGCSQAIWMVKTPPDVQGRVFSVRRLIAQFTIPLGDFAAGPLSDYVFEPLMNGDGALVPILGPIIGSGPGRGIGLMMLTFGIFPITTALIAYMIPKIANLEEEIPDAITDDDVRTGRVAKTSDDDEESGAQDDSGDQEDSGAQDGDAEKKDETSNNDSTGEDDGDNAKDKSSTA